MDFLFIHGNYPAQFKHLAALLGQNPNNRVVFLTAREDAHEDALPGVEIHRYSCHRAPCLETHHYLQATEEAVLQGQAVLREVSDLINKGLKPRIVVTHGGMGIGLFIKDLLPDVLHVGYFEWYFRPDTTRHLLAEFNLDSQLKVGLRNLPIIQELDRCDLAVVPTTWQKKQFPAEYQSKLEVIFDGIDQNFFKALPKDKDISSSDMTLTNRESGHEVLIRGGARVLSYATRGMEPLRGFPEFMRVLPKLLEKYSDLEVVIAGIDRRAYSYDAPNHSGSWKEHMLAELGPFQGKDRVHFVGLLTYPDYRNLLWRTTLHCYFTRPYVTSWSLFEAAACEAKLAISKGPATEGIVKPESAVWVDLDDQNNIETTLSEGLEKPNKKSKILPGFELSHCIQKWEKLLNSGLQSS